MNIGTVYLILIGLKFGRKYFSSSFVCMKLSIKQAPTKDYKGVMAEWYKAEM